MKIKIGFFSVLLFITLFYTHSYFALAAFAAVFLHELGHIVAAKLLKVKLKECKLSIYGAGLSPDNTVYSYSDEIILCVFGPLANILSCTAVIPLFLHSNNIFILYFIVSSMILATINLLPIKSFDGGRIMHSLICSFGTQRTADVCLSVTSFLLIFILWSLSVYVLIISGSGLSTFVFSISLFSKFFVDD